MRLQLRANVHRYDASSRVWPRYAQLGEGLCGCRLDVGGDVDVHVADVMAVCSWGVVGGTHGLFGDVQSVRHKWCIRMIGGTIDVCVE